MVILKGNYSEPGLAGQLIQAFNDLWGANSQIPIFLCIGSDRHILDCLGPLVGSMLTDTCPDIDVCGTLAEPLHARNLVSRMTSIQRAHPGRIHVAIDASMGSDSEIGTIRLHQGPLLPGKALSKRLPPVGHYSITGVVSTRSDRHRLRSNEGSLSPVYGMARIINDAVVRWYDLMANTDH